MNEELSLNTSHVTVNHGNVFGTCKNKKRLVLSFYNKKLVL